MLLSDVEALINIHKISSVTLNKSENVRVFFIALKMFIYGSILYGIIWAYFAVIFCLYNGL